MTWVRLDDGAPLHPKLLAVGPEGFALWTAGLAYANRAHTNGFIPRHALKGLYPWDGWTRTRLERLADSLVSVVLWTVSPDPRGWWIHNYSKFQAPALKENVEAQRAKDRRRKARERGQLSLPAREFQEPTLSVLKDSAGLDHLSRAESARTGSGLVNDVKNSHCHSKSVMNTLSHMNDSAGLGHLSRGTRPGTDTQSPDTPPPLSPPPPADPPERGRAPTVERVGYTADEFATTLRARAPGRVLAGAFDLRVLAGLQETMDGLSRGLPGPAKAMYEILADWYAAGSQDWRTGARLSLRLLSAPGVLSEHLEEALEWDRAGRPALIRGSASTGRRGRPRAEAPSTVEEFARDADAPDPLFTMNARKTP